MNEWPATRAGQVLRALERIGWRVKRQTGSHRVMERAGWPNYVFAFRDSDELGRAMLSRIGRATGLTPDDLKS